MEFNYDSISRITDFLKTEGIGLKKKWGQNFLVNRGAREKIVSLLDIRPGELIWEIGPGMGAMTQLILQSRARLVAFEIDRGLIRFLNMMYPGQEDFTLVQGDAVKTWPGAVRMHGMPVKILGNLPYASASAIISSYISGGLIPEKMVFTVQKELALRMTADPGNKNYSSFSIFCQFSFRVSLKGDLKPGSFYPVPEVVSTIIELVPVQREKEPRDRDAFFRVVRKAFHTRRKTLFNNLTSGRLPGIYSPEIVREALDETGLPAGIRGECLTIDDFIKVTDVICRLKQEDR